MIQIAVPPSKSVTQRALVLALLSDRPCTITNPLWCDDSDRLVTAMRALGARVRQEQDAWQVEPPESMRLPDQPLHLGNAGTAVRFLTGVALMLPGPITIDGNAAMRRRPMPGLLAALSELGTGVEELGTPGCPPVRITPPRLTDTGTPHRVTLDASGSSQQLSALLMAATRVPGGLLIELRGELPSASYVGLTERAMAQFEVPWAPEGERYRVVGGPPRCREFRVEGDWSSASYPLAAAWLTARPVELLNMDESSPQGDRAIRQLLPALDGDGPRELRMGDCPDLVPTVVACALFARGTTEVRDVAHLRIKESNRIDDLCAELNALGAGVEALSDGLRVQPVALSAAKLDPHDDHRLAMAFGLVSLRVPGLQIANRACVSKSYPEFWAMLERFR